MNIGDFFVGLNEPIFVIAGPCVIESEDSTLAIARTLKEMGEALGMPIIFKASYDKANRSSNDSFRGLGVDRGLEVLSLVKEKLGMPILTDVHSIDEVERVASVVDVLQTPAFLCRQTDFIRTVAATGLPVNIKKGQFLSPNEMQEVVKKAKNASGVDNVLVCERGASFGYNNLVSDMRSLAIMRNTNCPVVFDATHSVQLPGARGNASGGQREFVPVLARSAVAAGISGIFMETHPNPEQALSDGPNAWPLDRMEKLLKQIKQIDELVKATPFQEMDVNSATN
jgi:2-dehydro-3-deoxyphosphooctonate aldolase (KDO 8-P synthase)